MLARLGMRPALLARPLAPLVRRLLAAATAVAVVVAVNVRPAVAELDEMTTEERALAAWVNADRVWNGRPPILLDGPLTAQAQLQAERMAATGRLAHSPVGELWWWLARGWNVRVAENVAVAGTVADARAAVLESPAHLANQLDPEHRGFGVAIRQDTDGRVWVAWTYGAFR